MQNLACNSHSFIWWPHAIMINFGFWEQVFLLCATDFHLACKSKPHKVLQIPGCNNLRLAMHWIHCLQTMWWNPTVLATHRVLDWPDVYARAFQCSHFNLTSPQIDKMMSCLVMDSCCKNLKIICEHFWFTTNTSFEFEQCLQVHCILTEWDFFILLTEQWVWD